LDVNSANELGETPLHCCVRRGELSQVLSLLAHEAEVNAKDKHGNTALHFAVKVFMFFYPPLNNLNEIVIIKIQGLPEFAQDEAIDAVHAWLESNNESLVNVLSLDGGGIKGLVTLQILIHIQKRLESPIIDYFTWIAGTSTGAILALYFAKGETLESCRRLYLMLKDEVFAGTRPYPESKLESLLKKHFGDRTTFSHYTRVLITATSVTINPPKLELFRNYRLPLSDSENQKQGYKDPDDILVWKCARYSCAAPTYFSLLDGFADGGIIANNPTILSSLNLYSDLKKKRLRLGCVLSLGTGKKPQEIVDVSKFDFRIPNGAFHGYNMVCGALKFMNILKEQLTSSDGECVRRARNFSHASQVPFFRFSPPLAQNVELDDDREETAVLKNVITSETDKRSTVQVRHL
uniref:phospholipase A2 n=1 Tax=Syphacia muris TaxID=451379 RepID=A0A0N5A985_9BILA